MKGFLAGIGIVLLVALGLGALVALDWGGTQYSLTKYTHFAPQFENARRQTFENTHSYNQGMVQELENMQAQYVTTDKEHKALLADVILKRVAEYPHEDQLPPDLQAFINQLRRER